MYSVDMRRLAFIKLQKNGGKVRATARAVEVSPSTILRWRDNSSWFQSRVHHDKKRNRNRQRRKPSSRTREVCEFIRWFFRKPTNQTASIPMLQGEMQECGLFASISSIRRNVRSEGYSRKRLSNKVLGVVKPVDVLDYAQRHQAAIHPGTLVVSLDECYFSEKVMPLYGYSPVGECCKVRNKRGGWTKRSLILGIGSDGSCVHQVVLGSVKRTTFEAFVLSLTYPPGTVLLMDN
jgi:transposase